MHVDRTELLSEVARYYSSKLAQHGETPRGVDWNGSESQTLRFEQLSKLIGDSRSFSVNDLGCGYGAYYTFLEERHGAFSYCGIDVSEDMIRAAEQRCRGRAEARFAVAGAPDRVADFCVASGVFNVRLRRSDEEWRTYLEATLDALHGTARSGFAFNCLSSYSDADRMRGDLFYADPCAVFDRCKRRYARDVALLHDYGLYEFTILVRKHP